MPCAVGAHYAVLVAEQLFASGCRVLVSITSAGQMADLGPPPYYILIDRAQRDEATSYHYLPPGRWRELAPELLAAFDGVFEGIAQPVHRGATWATDAPFRETPEAITAKHILSVLAVEIEAAALYAFARARHRSVVCVALVTNQMGRTEGDFKKGDQFGADASLNILARVISVL